MSRLVYIDGGWVAQEEARISVFDHGFLYGDGVFEGIRAYGGRVFRLEAHLDRLYQSAKAILLTVPLGKDEMRQVVLDSCLRNGLDDAYIRLVVSRGPGDLGLDPRKCSRATVVCIAASIELYPQQLYREGLRAMTVATRRNHPEAVNPRIKSLNYLNNILAKVEANLAGYAEVIMLNDAGYVVECTGDNIFIVRGGRVQTPPAYLGSLEGITRAAVMELAQARGHRVEEAVFNRYDIWNADECFLTGTAAEVIPLVECDGRPIGAGVPGPVTQQLRADFRDLTRREGTPIQAAAAPVADRA